MFQITMTDMQWTAAAVLLAAYVARRLQRGILRLLAGTPTSARLD